MHVCFDIWKQVIHVLFVISSQSGDVVFFSLAVFLSSSGKSPPILAIPPDVKNWIADKETS